jgi:hypothetical protein
VGEGDPSEAAQLERFGLDPSAPDAADTLKLIHYLLDQGAAREDVEEAARTGTLGPLALELALSPPGDAVPFPRRRRGQGSRPPRRRRFGGHSAFPTPSARRFR